ncbi:hypothetical protein HAX54_037961, partial [Datura stramonium]|nr:hypothetical protein [Datura stramonium]
VRRRQQHNQPREATPVKRLERHEVPVDPTHWQDMQHRLGRRRRRRCCNAWRDAQAVRKNPEARRQEILAHPGIRCLHLLALLGAPRAEVLTRSAPRGSVQAEKF